MKYLIFALLMTAACQSRTSVEGAGSPTPTAPATPSPTLPPASGCGIGYTRGGELNCLSFAIVGDTRPSYEGDTPGYPTGIITAIYQDIEKAGSAFAVGTGDYQYADPATSQGADQLDLYMSARGGYSAPFFPTMGNHECTGYTDSNCIAGSPDLPSNNYSSYISKLLYPISQTRPWYSVNFNGPKNTWTAKFVFVAANAWDSAQAAWLPTVLAQPTTYTFVIRHEATDVHYTPGVDPSDAIIHQYPLTLLIVGHAHQLEYSTTGEDANELIVGIGGAPLTGSGDYGYVLATQRPSDGAMFFTAYDWLSGDQMMSFAIKPDGSLLSTVASPP